MRMVTGKNERSKDSYTLIAAIRWGKTTVDHTPDRGYISKIYQ